MVDFFTKNTLKIFIIFTNFAKTQSTAPVRDTYRHKGLRKKLVQELSRKGIHSASVLRAIGQIPRHYFLEKAFEEMAYKDLPFQIGLDQTISQPYIVAYQTQELAIAPGHKVLEIGTGSGYQAAVLSWLGAEVFSIERHLPLHKKAEEILSRLGLSAQLYFGDGFEGLPDHGPFDRIIVTAAAPSTPKKLLYQLRIGGKMIVPVGEENEIQKMKIITRIEENKFSMETTINCQFVPMLSGVKRSINDLA